MRLPRPRHALPALAFLAAACGPSYSSTSGSTSPTPTTSTAAGDMPGMVRYSANLAAMNSSTVHGTATVHSMNGTQTVQLQISGAAPGATYPWHIHTGSCADGMTPVVGDASLYTALGASGDGTASLMTTIPVTLNQNQGYHVNVHASPTDMGTIVACGDLAR
jgi:hypothetical protein